MGMDPFIGEIEIFAGNFAPAGWLLCDGAAYSIAQYQALYAIIGVTYGGDGRTNFNVPDLRGRLPVGMGQGRGLTGRSLGAQGGAESAALQMSNMPPHAHGIAPSKTAITAKLNAVADSANTPGAEEKYIATPPTNAFKDSGSLVQMAEGSISVDASGLNSTLSAGGNPQGAAAPVGLMPPFLSVNFIIAHTGIFPARE